ncbi:SDR family NAD(P)-dependent oxidoreductase [uncultured Aeromicrobium sp.]|uniref:SDR family NAD(P)-dependent oxidoreductase n=1 Tax=uncultured Aeromicrobium sp. TaxID=337820 RepID=UPI0025E6318D|nr:SDR family NAD(P)-dependent oxidoreductase [uncultured Aeromicrobium sp.]
MLTDKLILVTGAAQGMGREIALEAARQGAAHVGIADRDAEGLRSLAGELAEIGAEVTELEVDLAHGDRVTAMVDDFAAAAGGLDTLVNNAGVLDHVFTPADQVQVHQLDEAVWDTVMNINLKAVWLAIKAATPHLMASTNGPSIVNAASVAGMTGAGMTAYSVSKAAVIQLTRTAAIGLSPHIRVNAFSPGSIRTPMSQSHLDAAEDKVARARAMYGNHLIPRLGEVDEIAAAVCFLASDAASFITGVNLPVDGGTMAWRGVRDDITVD